MSAEVIGVDPKDEAIIDAQVIQREKHSIVVRAMDLAERIVDQNTYDECVGLMNQLKEARDAIANRTDPTKNSLHKAHKDFCALVDEMKKPFIDGIAILTNKMRIFAREQERKRQEAIDAEKKKIEDQRIKDAQVLVDAGKPEAAMEVIGREVRGVPKPPVFKKGGIRTKIDFEISITDPDTIVKNVAAGLLPKIYVEVNARAILQDVRAKNGKVTIPGVSIREV